MAGEAQRTEQVVDQRERMAALGALAAGLVHELKNPASASARAADLLKEQLAALDPLARRLAEHPWNASELGLLQQLETATKVPDQASRELDSVSRSDREERVGRWLEDHEVDRAWELAPLLVDRGVTVEQLTRVTKGCEASVIRDALAWTARMAAMRQLVDEVGNSTARITEIVRAVKAFSYVDTSTLRTADVHEGIESSLTILGHKLRTAKAAVAREYDRTLPPIETFGTLLIQLWTNLIDNAVDAMATHGDGARVIRVRTRRDDDGQGVAVEIADTGAGIAPAVRDRIFDPFVTTKEAGSGTGLGLEIVRRIVAGHHGSVDVTSVPGDTRFVVRLPLRQPRADSGQA